MPKQRRSIPTRGANRFIVSERNPNAHGECLCSPTGRHEDCTGPFMVFTHADLAAVGGKAPLAVVSVGCAKAAVLHVERGEELSQVGSGSAADDEFDGGEPTEPEDEQALKAQYEVYVRDTGLMGAMDWDDYRKEHGFPKHRARRPLETTGIDPHAKSILQARADASPVRVKPVAGVTSEPGASDFEGALNEDGTERREYSLGALDPRTDDEKRRDEREQA